MGTRTPSELSAIREALLAELDRIAGRLQEMESSSRKAMEAEGVRPGFGKRVGDFTSEAVEAANNSAVARNMGHSADEIRRAIEKIDRGTYGLCDGCGGPIGEERLEYLPAATLCVECKRKKEGRRR
jgi:DnaK suppressor protein